MLKQLRWKITGLIMSVVVILLTAIFLALYSSTALSYRNRSMEAMRTALQQNQSGQLKPGQEKPQAQAEPQPDSTQPPKQEQNSSMPSQRSSETPLESPPEKPQNEPNAKTSSDPSLNQPKNTDSPPPPRQEISAVAVVEIGTLTNADGKFTNETAPDEVLENTDTEETNFVLENHIPALSDEDAITFALLAEKEEKDGLWFPVRTTPSLYETENSSGKRPLCACRHVQRRSCTENSDAPLRRRRTSRSRRLFRCIVPALPPSCRSGRDCMEATATVRRRCLPRAKNPSDRHFVKYQSASARL